MKKRNQIILGLVFSVIAILLIVFTVDMKKSWIIIKDFNVYYLIILSLVFPFSFFLRTMLWWFLLSQKNKISIKIVFEGLAIGYMSNNLLPAKLGEVIKGEYIINNSNFKRSFVYGTIFVERLIDVIFVLLFLLLSVLLSKTLMLLVVDNSIIIVGIVLVIISIIYLYFNRSILKRLLKLVPEKLSDKVKNLGKTFISSLDFIVNAKMFAKIFSISFLIWLTTLFSVFLILHGLNITFPLQYYLFIVAGGTFGLLIPSTSGGIGVYHTVAMSILIFLEINKETAFAYAVISHAFDFFPNIILGLVVMIKKNYKLINDALQH